MKNMFLLPIVFFFITTQVYGQIEPSAGKWKTWFIASANEYRIPAPPSFKEEIAEVLAAQKELDEAGKHQIVYWNAGSPGYRWYEMISKLWIRDTTYNGALANMLLNVAVYDATIAAWDAKYTYNRPRPFLADRRIRLSIPKPESPSYPCEHSVAAGVAATIIAHFYPSLADSVNRMAQRAMAARVAAGAAFPSDTRAGFELGKRIAQKEIEHTKGFVPKTAWDGKVPEGPGLWRGKKPMLPLAGKSKTVVLDSSSQFRPGPPPDFAKDMAELKAFKQTFRSQSNAFRFANETYADDPLHRKIFEYNLHLNPPRAARLYAAAAIAMYDTYVACWDAKYAYWGIRPDQYDTTYKPLLPTPSFPGYPSGHAALAGAKGELYSYFFPADRPYFEMIAKDCAESRFHGGIHFRTDNDVALDLGKKVATMVIRKIETDGADEAIMLAKKNKAAQ